MQARIVFKPAQAPSASEQYWELAKYFEELGEMELAEFYKKLSKKEER